MIKKASQRFEKGQSMVEMAISWVVLVMLLAAVVDFGRAFYTYISLRDAAQEGALYASTYPANNIVNRQNILSRACSASNFMQSKDCKLGPTGSIDDNTVVVEVTNDGPACHDGANGIQVVVRYPQFRFAVPFLGTILGSDTLEIRATIVDTVLRPPCT